LQFDKQNVLDTGFKIISASLVTGINTLQKPLNMFVRPNCVPALPGKSKNNIKTADRLLRVFYQTGKSFNVCFYFVLISDFKFFSQSSRRISFTY